MNLNKLFQIQKQLDERIIKEHELEGQDLLDKKILALQVELGELANELPEIFKFWSHKKNNYEKALKEYVDGLHFILSIGLELKNDHARWFQEDGPIDFTCLNITNQFNSLFERVVKLRDNLNFECEEYEELFYAFISLGGMLGFTTEQIEDAYMIKNQINIERQNNGY